MPSPLSSYNRVCPPPKHTGVRSLFNRYYVKTRKVPQELGETYNDLFARREESDYLDFLSFEEAQVRPWITRAETFVEHIASMIETQRE